MDFDALRQGFSREAQVYDAELSANPIMYWARTLVRNTAVTVFSVEASLLEINAGSGLDAAWLVAQGYSVHATDVADGMMAAIHAKIQASEMQDRFTAQQLSFDELENVENAPFDGLLSNFGGLNCTPDLSMVFREFRNIIIPGGCVILVIMPPVCPWELAEILRGHWRASVRRLKRKGVAANVGGSQIMTYYFTPGEVMRALGPEFALEGLRSFSLFCPPMAKIGFATKFKRLTQYLMRLDEIVGRWPMFRNCGDFFILTARYQPGQGK
jgi:ubiquinone/menaquinone biosynthesis C-methylase UbiE